VFHNTFNFFEQRITLRRSCLRICFHSVYNILASMEQYVALLTHFTVFVPLLDSVRKVTGLFPYRRFIAELIDLVAKAPFFFFFWSEGRIQTSFFIVFSLLILAPTGKILKQIQWKFLFMHLPWFQKHIRIFTKKQYMFSILCSHHHTELLLDRISGLLCPAWFGFT
jgi:hypothetical protein